MEIEKARKEFLGHLISNTGCIDFYDAYGLADKNSNGKIWLIGSQVFSTISHEFYDTCSPKEMKSDWDFVVEEIKNDLSYPTWMNLEKNRYGNPKFHYDEFSVDLIPLNSITYLKETGLKPTIDNFLMTTPLNIQSIAWDIKGEKLIGDIGIKAILDRSVGINNLDSAAIYAEKKSMSITELMKQKRIELCYDPIFRGKEPVQKDQRYFDF